MDHFLLTPAVCTSRAYVCISFGALMAYEAVVVLCVDDEIAGSLIRCCTTNNIVTIIFLFIPYILILFSSSFVLDSFLFCWSSWRFVFSSYRVILFIGIGCRLLLLLLLAIVIGRSSLAPQINGRLQRKARATIMLEMLLLKENIQRYLTSTARSAYVRTMDDGLTHLLGMWCSVKRFGCYRSQLITFGHPFGHCSIPVNIL